VPAAKLNSFEFGEFPEEEQFDILEDDLPVLLGRFTTTKPILRDSYEPLQSLRSMLCHGDGFDVEWRENRSLTDFADYDQWRADTGSRLTQHDAHGLFASVG